MSIKLKVVVIDDMKILADNLCSVILENENVEEVYTEYNGEDGLISILNNEPDIVFTDNQMPCRTGIEFIEELQHYQFEQMPKLVLVTADNDIELIRKSQELGFELVHKPISDRRVFEIIEEVANTESDIKTREQEQKIEVKKENFFTRIFNKNK